MKKNILLLAMISSLCFLSQIASAQKQGNEWYFAGNNAIDFNSGNPVLIPNCPISYVNTEGTATISDSSGNLLFYATAETIWNKNNQPMQNGTGLLGGTSATQGVFIVPLPNSDSIFYLFTLDEMQNCFQNGLRYSIVNICLDNGLGAIGNSDKNILLLDSAGEKMAATFHANGNDVWLIVHKYFSDAFYSFLITATGITNTVISHVGSYHPADSTTDCWQAIGQMKISPNGSKLALVNGNANTQSIAELFDFNNITGTVSNVINLQPDSSFQYYGVSFSPDDTKLYITSVDVDNVYQFDLSSGISSNIIASKTIIYHNGNGIATGLQIAPDGKIYVVVNGYNYLDVITNPNAQGLACNYISNSFNLFNVVGLSFPNFIDSYNYKNGIPDCNALGINEINQTGITFSSNPVITNLIITSSQNSIIEIQNITGQIIKKIYCNSNSATIDFTDLKSGIYIVSVTSDKEIVTNKVIKE